MTVGERIKLARKKAGMTQADLAQKLGIPFQGVSQWERDIRNPKIETLRRIAEALNCPLVFLAGGTDEGHSIQKDLIQNNNLAGLDVFLGREPGTFQGVEKISEDIKEFGSRKIKTTKYKLKIKGYDGNAFFIDREEIDSNLLIRAENIFRELNIAGQREAIKLLEILKGKKEYQKEQIIWEQEGDSDAVDPQEDN